MTIDIITLFPNMFVGPFSESMVKRATEKGLATINIHNLRTWAIDERGTVDDRPYGGGPGMLLRPEPIFTAVESIQSNRNQQETGNNQSTILLDAGGKPYNQKTAEKLATCDSMIIICGHYEGVDYRVHEHLADEVISIGDFVMTGGEIPAMALVDSVVRLIPGVLNKQEAASIESFSGTYEHTVEYPQYTRPESYNGFTVPDILLTGHHEEIEKWRKKESLKRTEVRLRK